MDVLLLVVHLTRTLMEPNASIQILKIFVNLGNTLMESNVSISLISALKEQIGMARFVFLISILVLLDFTKFKDSVRPYLNDVSLQVIGKVTDVTLETTVLLKLL